MTLRQTTGYGFLKPLSLSLTDTNSRNECDSGIAIVEEWRFPLTMERDGSLRLKGFSQQCRHHPDTG